MKRLISLRRGTKFIANPPEKSEGRGWMCRQHGCPVANHRPAVAVRDTSIKRDDQHFLFSRSIWFRFTLRPDDVLDFKPLCFNPTPFWCAPSHIPGCPNKASFCYAVNVLLSCFGLGMTGVSNDNELVSMLAK